MPNLDTLLPPLFQRLLGLLAGPDYEVRRAALVAFSKLRGMVAAEIVFERFQSDNLEDYLMLAMKTLDPDRAGKILVAALNDPHLEVRIQAAEALVRKPSEESIFALTAAVEAYLNRNKLSSGDKGVLMTEESLLGAAKALGDIAAPMCLSLLRKLVLQETNSKIRATAVAALCNKPTDSLMPVLQGLLKDPDPRVRANAIEGIQKLDKASAIGLLQPYLYDPHQRVRANAAKAIWKFGDYEVSDTIKEMLTHKDKRQIVSGIYAIGEIRVESFLKTTAGFLYHQDADVRRNAVIALKKFGKTNFAIEFKRMVDDPVPEVRIQAMSALVEVIPEGARDVLLARLGKEPEPGVRSVVIGHLGRVGAEATLGTLSAYLDDGDERVVTATIDSLVRLKPHDPTPGMVLSVRKFLKGTGRGVLRRAICALWRWGLHDVLETVTAGLESKEPEIQASSLKAVGEIFIEVSDGASETLKTFDDGLRKAVDDFRRTLRRASSVAMEKQIQDWLQQATEDTKAGRFADAKARLDEVLDLQPDHLQAWLNRGELCLNAGELDQAEGCFAKALELGPNTVKAHYALGQVYCRKGEWEKALKPLETTIRLYPKLPQVYLLLADALEPLGRFADAREVLRRLQLITAPNPMLQQRYARTCFQAGAVGEAIGVSRQVAGKAPADMGQQLILAVGEALEGKGSQACRSLLGLLAASLDQPPNRGGSLPRMIRIAIDALTRKESEQSAPR